MNQPFELVSWVVLGVTVALIVAMTIGTIVKLWHALSEWRHRRRQRRDR